MYGDLETLVRAWERHVEEKGFFSDSSGSFNCEVFDILVDYGKYEPHLTLPFILGQLIQDKTHLAPLLPVYLERVFGSEFYCPKSIRYTPKGVKFAIEWLDYKIRSIYRPQ
jgi:hypothetical protein